MSLRVKFWLLAEGSSDSALVPHLATLCLEAGADEVLGDAPDLGQLPGRIGKAVRDKVSAALKYGAGINLLFIHRDADGPDAAPVHAQIREQVLEANPNLPFVALVPVQELEAWLLLDERAIRSVVGNPNGRGDLGLPSPSQIEQTRDPKGRLRAALERASDRTGRRAQQLQKRFGLHRSALFQLLDREGPVRQLPSFRRLTDDIEVAVRGLRNVETPS